jgi:hypothetical protein
MPCSTEASAPQVIDIRKLYAQTGMFTYDPGFTSTASCEAKITYIDGDEGVLLHRGYPIDQLGRAVELLEVCYLLLNGELPTSRLEEFTTHITRHTMVHEQLRRFFAASAATRTRWRSCAAWSARCRPSITTRPTSTTRPAHGREPPPDREDADDRRDGLQIFGRPAVRLSAQRSRLHLATSCACAFAVPAEDYKVEPGARARDGPHLHPARRPRAERLDLDRASGRLVGRQPVRLHRGRHRLPVGPCAWRRQRSGAQHAARDRHRRPHSGISSRAPRTRTIRSA